MVPKPYLVLLLLLVPPLAQQNSQLSMKLRAFTISSSNIPQPQQKAYATINQYREDLQKYKQCNALVKVAMKDFLSDELYELFIAEQHCEEGMKMILLEIKYDEASQLRLLQRQLELMAQSNSQTLKEYSDSVNHLVLQLQSLGAKTSEAEFQKGLSERFLFGMDPQEARSLRVVFEQRNITVFKDMRAYINEEAANEELSKAQ